MPGLFTGASGLFGGFPGLLYGGSALSTPPGLLADAVYGGGTPAGILLGQETSGMAMDFTSSPANLLVRTATSLQTNYYSGLPFQNEGNGPITFSRASNATVVDSDGKIKWAPHNLLTNSESFDASAWAKSGLASVSANNAAAPNGTTTSDKLLEDTSVNAQHLCSQSLSVGANQAYTFSCFAKSAERTNIALQLATTGGTVTRFAANFDLAAGTVSKTDSVSSPLSTSSSIAPVGGGWYLCTIGMTTISTATTLVFYVGTSDSNNPTFSSGFPVFTGVSGSGALVWGAHLYRSDLGGMQANTSAYPMYNPTTPKNLLGYTEDFSNAAWVKDNGTAVNPVVTANAGVAPNGLTTADRIVFDRTGGTFSRIQQTFGAVIGTNYTFSVWMRTFAGGTANVGLRLDATGVNCVVTGTWTRFSVSAVGPAVSSLGCQILLFSAIPGNDVTADVLVWGAQLSDSASLDAYVPSYGAAPTSAAYYGPRRDFDPVTLACKGLLVEEQRTNIALYSAQFDDTYWQKSAAGLGVAPVVTANAAIAPDGTMSADRVVMSLGGGTTTSDSSQLAGGPTYTVASYTFSIWLKSNTGSDQNILLINCNTQSIVVIVTPQWQRFTHTVTGIAATSAAGIRLRGTFTGNAADILVWGAQVEAGSFATSYIPTGAATATRSADIASVSTQAFPYSATEGTLVWNYSAFGQAVSGGRVVALGLAGSNSYGIFPIVVSSTQNQIYIRDISGDAIGGTLYTANQSINKGAAAYKVNDFAVASNGSIATTSSSGAVPSQTDVLRLGRAINTDGAFLNGHIRQITYLPRRITNAELQQRTS